MALGSALFNLIFKGKEDKKKKGPIVFPVGEGLSEDQKKQASIVLAKKPTPIKKEEPKPFAFPIGEGLTPQQTAQARTVVQKKPTVEPGESQGRKALRLGKELLIGPAVARQGVSFAQQLREQAAGRELPPFRPKSELGRFLLEPSANFEGVKTPEKRLDQAAEFSRRLAGAEAGTLKGKTAELIGTAAGLPLLGVIETTPGGKAKTTAAKKILAKGVRLDKFDLPDEGIANLKKIIDDNAGFIDQRRGTMSFEDTQKLADELMPNIKLKKGTSLKAEELQALGDTVATLQSKVSDAAKVVADGDDSTRAAANLIAAQEELATGLSSLVGAQTEAGRSLSILRNLKRATETGDDELLRKAVKLAGGREKVETIAKHLVGLGDDNLAKLRYVQGLGKATKQDKLTELWINSILSSPKTQAVNITSNLIRGLFEIPLKAGEAALGKLPGVKQRAIFSEIPHQVVGMMEGFHDGVRKATEVFKTGLTPDQISKLDIGRLPTIEGRTGEIVRIPTKMLTAADEFFKTLTGTAEMRAIAYRNAKKEGHKGQKIIERMHELIASPTKEMLDEVDLRKLQVTFQQPMGRFGDALVQFRNKAPGARFVIPFIKTPTNILKDAIKTSPAGFANVLRKSLKGEFKNLPEGEQTREIAQAVIGSAMAIPIVNLAMQDKITGAPPKTQSERTKFFDIEKKQPFSIKVGDQWVSYARIEPFATVFGMVADFVETKNEDELDDKAAAISRIIGQNITNKTWLQGLNNVIEGISDPKGKGARSFNQIIAGGVPFSGLQRFVAQGVDPTIRRPEGLLQTIQAQTPFASKGVTPLRDVFGEEIRRTPSQALTPFGVTSAQQNELQKQLEESDISLGKPGRTIQKIKLTQEEYDNYSAISGQVQTEVLAEIVQTDDWAKANAQERKNIVESITRKTREKVRDNLFPVKVRANDIFRKFRERGLSEAEAMKKTRELVSDLESELQPQ